MKCTNPLIAIDLNQHWKKATKKDLKFLPTASMDIDNIINANRYDYQGHTYTPIVLPCGKCMACRINKASEWATRIMLEAKYHPKNSCWFVTCTYRDEELVLVDDVDGATRPTLIPQHLTKFLKDLRYYYDYHFNHSGIRFFACGEYGDLYLRPHFHIILFNMPIFDEKIFTVRNNQPVFHVPALEKCWKRGFIECTPLTYDSAAYVARYTQKKVNGFISQAHYGNLEPEFIRMSRMPGIGRLFYDDNRDDIFTTDEINLIGRKGKVQTVKPPSYYNDLFDVEMPDVYPFIKDKRLADKRKANADFKKSTDIKYSDYLDNLSEKYNNIGRKLVRPLEKERS